MIGAWIVSSALLAASPPPEAAVSPETAAQYKAAQEKAGRDPDAHVRLALWCEQNGLTAERLKHLSIAVMTDPTHATARGLLGMVADEGRWRRAEDVSRRVREDAKLGDSLAEYNARRAKTPDVALAQWKLAEWCRTKGLIAEAVAHYTAVTRLDPDNQDAWKRLGFRRHHGRWATDEQVASAIVEKDAQRSADRRWGPLLGVWKDDLKDAGKAAEAEARLAAVSDPRAVPSIHRIFGMGSAADQSRAVQLLGQISAPQASRALAILAVSGKNEAVRRAAAETLAWQDPRDFMEPLISLIRDTIKYEVIPVEGPGSLGVLKVEGQQYNVERRYEPPPPPAIHLNPGDSVAYDADGLPVITRPVGEVVTPVPGENRLVAVQRAAQVISVRKDLAEANRSAQVARMQQEADVRSIQRANSRIRRDNERVTRVLSLVGKKDLGADRAEPWKTWWADESGYSYQAPAAPAKETHTEDVPLAYAANFSPMTITGPVIGYRTTHSCFAAGTPVRTLSGSRSIESLKVGDRVLTQDVKTGGLSFQPILAVYHNPPNETYKVTMGDESIVATGIHRFWKAGKGWAMARDLKPGDAIRSLGGLTKVADVQPDKVQPVYNLEVAKGRSFFVGDGGALVHDNSLVEPTPEPFDAPISAATPAP